MRVAHLTSGKPSYTDSQSLYKTCFKQILNYGSYHYFFQETNGLPVDHQNLSGHEGGDLIESFSFCGYGIKDGA